MAWALSHSRFSDVIVNFDLWSAEHGEQLEEQSLDLRFDLEPFWHPTRAHIPLQARLRQQGAQILASVCAGAEFPDDQTQPWPLDAPLRLYPVTVAKPWGEEIWFSGMEARGVSEIGDDRRRIPLPWWLALAPQRLCGGRERELLLLKILAPHADPQLGDLYFELHREKREVYVVTNVDARAWHDGRGAIRLGMNSKLVKSIGKAKFLQQYLAAVRAYETVRRAIDEQLDRQRTDLDIEPNQALEPQTQLQWLAAVPAELRAQEERLRLEMYRFTQLKRLEVGDVVVVPTLTPHALQHGVRVAEFQTPVYERMILSFGQKVLTQSHWDTAEAVAQMRLDVAVSKLKVLAESPDHRIERICDFEDFVVLRIRLGARRQWLMPGADYALIMGVIGRVRVESLELGAEEAAFVPKLATQAVIGNLSEDDSVFLLAIPQAKLKV